jgi:hypothetical protein
MTLAANPESIRGGFDIPVALIVYNRSEFTRRLIAAQWVGLTLESNKCRRCGRAGPCDRSEIWQRWLLFVGRAAS